MPRGDGTGPNGQGAMTGRGLGYCAGYPIPGFMSPGFGRGRGRGRGFGRGLRFRARFIQPQVIPVIQEQPLTTKDEKALLNEDKDYIKQEMEILKQEIEAIEKRLKELK